MTSDNELTPQGIDISPVSIVDEMRSSYLDYAMSVIVSRALPDVRDGLKPVHRRILYAMKESGYDYNKPYRKSARIVGDVMGKYHPHGDSAIYDAMVRMAQDFSMRLPLIDGQGNFGSMDGDPPAAMRYTEARMDKAAHNLIADIDKETVDFKPNYDDTTLEPSVLPAQYPNLLVNGAGGIAVGMATNIPPHNLGELIDACCALIDDPNLTIDDLIRDYVFGPDFPTGGIILGQSGLRSAFHTGRGSVVMRGKTSIEEIRKDRMAIIITEIPYQVNKARMIESMAALVRDKKIEGISDLRDESDRQGVRVVVEIKKGHHAEIVLNQLFKFTALQTSFGVNMLALNQGRPELMNLKQILEAFIAFREEVITRRTIFELGKARDKAHVLAGLAVAVENIDEVIELIRAAPDAQTARTQLMERKWRAGQVEPLIQLLDEPDRQVVNGEYQLSEAQAKAILELRLHRLTGLEREKIAGDLRELGAEIEEYLSILRSREKLMTLMRNELVDMRTQFATPRRSEIQEAEFEHDIEDLIQREDMVVTVTSSGYIKRVPLDTYRAQRRGGKGRSGMSTKDEDIVENVFVANTHTPLLFFSSTGMVYKMKVYRLPLGTPQSKGKAMVNLLPLDEGETISTVMELPEDESQAKDMHVMFSTASGGARRNLLSDFTNVKANGKIAMKLDDGDAMVAVEICTPDDHVFLTTRNGQCIRFKVEDVRVFAGRNSTGVRGIRLADDDRVISMSILNGGEWSSEERDSYLRYSKAKRAGEEAELGVLSQEQADEMEGLEEFLLSVTERGFGKRSSSFEYRTTGRGGKGIANIEMSARNGHVAASFPVEVEDEIIMVTDGGQLIRTGVDQVRIAGRKTQGVTLFRVADGESVVSVSCFRDMGDDEEEKAEGENAETAEGNKEETENTVEQQEGESSGEEA
ncbi:DNA gyrase subunit A [Terasakiella sp. A23]|uniref:DNA gyrase subunit A n=1 Tax=Terasakiella sp. FCG-A23 TaxID=3080561 RepID=UPI002952D220|nr:DNA gyrase subunit A [Terasakiella sp. A23]MDV7339392.1 DNA gyrase subunit A [Terasakiella sp. A23]